MSNDEWGMSNINTRDWSFVIRHSSFVTFLTLLTYSTALAEPTLKTLIQEELTLTPPDAVYLSLDRTPREELAALHLLKERFPHHGAVAHRRALLLFHLGYHEEAETAYRAARRVAPDLEFMMFHALQALRSSSDPLPAYREAVHVDRQHPESRWAVGFLALTAKRWAEALEHFQHLSLTHSSSWSAATLYNLAVAGLMAGEVDAASSALERLEGASAAHWRVELLRGHLTALRGEDPTASYHRSHRLAPSQIDPAFYLGMASAQRRQWHTALAAFDHACRLDPASDRLRTHRQRAHDGTLEEARQMLELHLPHRTAELASLMLTLGPTRLVAEEAKDLLHRATVEHATSQGLDADLGEALMLELDAPPQALAVYERVLRAYPDHAVAASKAAELRRALGHQVRQWMAEATAYETAFKPHRALTLLDDLLSLQSDHVDGRALKERIESRLTLSSLKRLEADRSSLGGEIAAGEGKWEEAIRLWKTALELDYYNVSLRDKIHLAQEELKHTHHDK